MSPLTQILSIARAGNPARAWAMFQSSGWDVRTDDPKALTLKGRLLKDQAKAAQSAERVRLYGMAAEAYAAAAQIEQASYPLINAATLAYLGGRPERAVQLAGDVLDLLADRPDEAETAYWLAATRSEALLLLGKNAEARAALTEAMATAPKAWEDHAATIGQFELILAEHNEDDSWLNRHRPPPSLYFSGLIALDENDPKLLDQIETIIAQDEPGFGFGALTAGADILIAEALHRAGAELHITLPYPVARFCELSVEPYGDHWLPRFDMLMTAATRVDILSQMPGEDERPVDVAVDLCNLVTMGQCARNAQILCSSAKAITIVGTGEDPRRLFPIWQQSGRDHLILETRRTSDRPRARRAPATIEQLHAILWVKDMSSLQIADQQEAGFDFVAAQGDHYHLSRDLTGALTLARKLEEAGDIVKTSMVIDAIDPSVPPTTILQRAEDIAHASEGGPLLTDHKTAMALTLLAPDRAIQEIGELQTAYGFIPLWSIS